VGGESNRRRVERVRQQRHRSKVTISGYKVLSTTLGGWPDKLDRRWDDPGLRRRRGL
jgi:hypothetical protein